ASILNGGNTDKILPIWWGTQGNEGKSTGMSTCKKAMGDYHAEPPSSNITTSRGHSGSATPEHVPRTKAPMAGFKEPDADDTMRIGKLKELTGDDPVYVRRLFHESTLNQTPIMSKIFLHCNEVPPTNSPTDKATRNRIVIIPFITIWSHEAPALPEEQR